MVPARVLLAVLLSLRGLLSAFYLAGMQRPPPILIYVPPSLRYEQNSSGSQQVQCSLTFICSAGTPASSSCLRIDALDVYVALFVFEVFRCSGNEFVCKCPVFCKGCSYFHAGFKAAPAYPGADVNLQIFCIAIVFSLHLFDRLHGDPRACPAPSRMRKLPIASFTGS